MLPGTVAGILQMRKIAPYPTLLFPGTQTEGGTDTSRKILNGIKMAISAVCPGLPTMLEKAKPWTLIPAWTLAQHRPMVKFLIWQWESWSTAGVGKLHSIGRIWSIPYFCTACEVRIVFMLWHGWKKNSEEDYYLVTQENDMKFEFQCPEIETYGNIITFIHLHVA